MYASAFAVSQIGELAKELSDEIQITNADIPLLQMAGFLA